MLKSSLLQARNAATHDQVPAYSEGGTFRSTEPQRARRQSLMGIDAGIGQAR
jgi:hypothetical protein